MTIKDKHTLASCQRKDLSGSVVLFAGAERIPPQYTRHRAKSLAWCFDFFDISIQVKSD